MMDTVYGTKKYFQSLSGGSDIYRTSTCRAVTNDYSSYQNTLGRRSTIGPYTHMNKHPSYSTDLSSQYGYNTWGMWRDMRNLSPSTYSSKSRQSVKSFSIILTTAAFIVVLAVLTIAGLAFYFSTFKTNLDEPIMAFQGSFRITKGDVFTTGLKYNHTSIYRQKVDFYKRFVERSLQDNNLHLTKVDITEFGDGPLINVHFRVFLDMRRIPQTIHSVEEHIRESLYLETNSMKSLYKSLRIEPDTIIIKRILDEDLIKSATFTKDSAQSVSQTHFEKRLNKKSGTIEKTNPKISSTHKPKLKLNDDEPEIDVENAPVIQGSFEGSFEITKTDADITRKRTSPTKSVTSTTKSDKRVKVKTTKIEQIEITRKPTELSSTTKSTTTTRKTTTTKTTTTPKPTTTTTSTTTTTTTTLRPTTSTTTSLPSTSTSYSTLTVEEHSKYSNVQDPPRLDANLFTSAPVLDTEPWRPIRPPNPSLSMTPIFNLTSEMEAIESGLIPRNKMKFSDQVTENPNDMIFYHSFTNPVFMPGTVGIEKLGNSDVKPHPLPVPLIDDVVVPNFKPIQSISPNSEQYPDVLEIDRFEHIGGGVIVKKHDNISEIVSETQNVSSTTESSTQPIILESTSEKSEVITPTTIDKILGFSNETSSTEYSEKIGELLYDLLELPERDKNNSQNFKLESRIEPDEISIENSKENVGKNQTISETDEKPNFLNIKEHILNRNKETTQQPTIKPSIQTTRKSSSSSSSPVMLINSTKPTILPSRTETTIKPTPNTIDQSMLFPSQTKWEYVNSSSNSYPSSSGVVTKKVFNSTLQAWIVENADTAENPSKKEIKIKHHNNAQDIQNISFIFDTLASKLGISPTIQTKQPPFSGYSQNKLKQQQNSRNDTKITSTTKLPISRITSIPTNIRRRITTTTKTTTTSSTSTTEFPPDSYVPINFTSNIPELLNNSPEIIIGEAEVEVVDPTKYEEMLSSSQASSTSTLKTPTLVTLLPVRSNSGIRKFRPAQGGNVESRRFSYNIPRYREAVVKTGIQVTT